MARQKAGQEGNTGTPKRDRTLPKPTPVQKPNPGSFLQPVKKLKPKPKPSPGGFNQLLPKPKPKPVKPEPKVKPRMPKPKPKPKPKPPTKLPTTR